MPAPTQRTPAKSRPRAAAAPALPITVRSRTDVSRRLKREVQEQVSAQLAGHATLIERVTVRFDDVNGPKGGVDIDCEVKVDVAGLPSVIVTERAASPGVAFASVLRRVTRAVRKELDRHGRHARRPARAAARRPTKAAAKEVWTPLIGRDVGQGRDAVARALDRPEKRRRDALVDTSVAGTSATDRRAGGDHSARRNSRAPGSRMSVVLEDAAERPSRRSTRRSLNRGKPSQGKERAAVAEVIKPSTRAARGAGRARPKA